ncbi:MAG: hypothetical protein ACKVP0_24495 [Pirellulaceae bacterium]
MSVTGIISNGVVVLPAGISFPEGTKVEVITPQPISKPKQGSPAAKVPEPRDEWERRLLAVASDCGVSLSNEALGREEMYD